MNRLILSLLLALAALPAEATTKATHRMISGAPIDVLDKGARCDGTTDDAAAFQRAFGAVPAGGATVLLPAGNCKLVHPQFTLKDGTHIRGAGRGATTLTLTGQGAGDYALDFYLVGGACGNGSAGGCLSGWVSDLTIAAGGGNGIRFGPFSWYRSGLSNVEIRGARWALDVDGTYGVDAEDLFVTDASTVRGVYVHNGANTAHLRHLIVWDGATDASVLIDNAGEVTLDGRAILQGWSNGTGRQVRVQNGASNVALRDVHLETTPTASYQFLNAVSCDASRGLHVAGATFGGVFAGAIVSLNGCSNVTIERSDDQAGSATNVFLQRSGTNANVTLRDNAGTVSTEANHAGLDKGLHLGGPFSFQLATVPFAANLNLDGSLYSAADVTVPDGTASFNLTSIYFYPGQAGAWMCLRIKASGTAVTSVGLGSALRMGTWGTLAAWQARTLCFMADGTHVVEATRSADVPY